MPKDSAHTFKLGLMVSLGLLLLALLIIVSGDLRPFRSRYTLNIIFNDVAGLEVGSPVRLAGMKVGEVKEMHVKDRKIEVVVLIDRNVKIYRDTRASINFMGLIGEKYISLSMGETGPYLKDRDSITGIDPVSIGEMLVRVETIVKKIEEGVNTLYKICSETEIISEIEGIIKNIEAFSQDLNSLIKGIRVEITDGLKDFSESSKEFRDVSSKMKGILKELGEGLGGKGKDIEEIIRNLKVVSNRLTDITQDVQKGEGLAGKIFSDKKVAQDLALAIKDLKELMADLREHPWKLMKKR